jgi:hypothetical protein
MKSFDALLINGAIVDALGCLHFGSASAVNAGSAGAMSNLHHLSSLASLRFTVAVALWSTIIAPRSQVFAATSKE